MRRPAVDRGSAVILVLCIFWVLIGEFGIPHLYSSRWEWPKLDQFTRERLEKDFILQDPGLTTPSRHYRNGDIHYYTAGSERPAVESGLHALILSDPHIMCTFDKYVDCPLA